jgi:hypothetical protein
VQWSVGPQVPAVVGKVEAPQLQKPNYPEFYEEEEEVPLI